jgi:predicted TIM-barrel fold metal-dependent hydrolase
MKNHQGSKPSKRVNALSPGRRRFLGFGALAVGLSSLPGCATIKCFLAPEKGEALFIDAHTHIFNAEDLPIYGFVKKVLGTEMKLSKSKLSFLKPLMFSLDKLIQLAAKDGSREGDKLAKILGDDSEMALAKNIELKALDEESDEEIRSVLIPILEERIKTDSDTYAEVAEEMSEPGENKSKSKKSLWGRLKTLYLNTLFGRILGLVNRYRTWRYKNAARLIKTFEDSSPGAKDGNGMDLFVVALVDLDYWVNDHSRSTIPEQIDVTTKINRLYDGRLLPFVAFDPFRNIVEKGKPLEWVQTAILEHGFIGVKMYPPMGFRPLGNSEFDGKADKWPEHMVNTDKMKVPKYFKGSEALIRNQVPSVDKLGSRLDTQLRALYKWCEDNHVPIMVHSNDSNGSFPKYEKRAAPEYWAPVLEEFPDLRLNLGHFGGWDDVAANASTDRKPGVSDWSGEIVGMMTDKHPNLYADFSNFHAIHDSNKREDIVAGIRKLFGKNNGVLKSRLLYGSDWFMSTARKGNDKYFSDANEFLNESFEAERAAILGGNAVNFLGLRDDEGTADRLRTYYGDNPPAWMQRLLTS